MGSIVLHFLDDFAILHVETRYLLKIYMIEPLMDLNIKTRCEAETKMFMPWKLQQHNSSKRLNDEIESEN